MESARVSHFPLGGPLVGSTIGPGVPIVSVAVVDAGGAVARVVAGFTVLLVFDIVIDMGFSSGSPLPVELAGEDGVEPVSEPVRTFVFFFAPTPAPTAMAMITSRTAAAMMILPLLVRQKGTRA